MTEQTATSGVESLSNVLITPASGSENPPRVDDWDDTPLPQEVLDHPLLAEAGWVALRDRDGVRMPLDQSELVTTYQHRAEFLVGAWVLDRTVPRRLGGSLLGNLQPQMLRTADVLAAEHRLSAVLEPRRSSKTTSLWCVLIGRCWMRPQYMAGYTMMTTAQKAAERFQLDVRNPITLRWPAKSSGWHGDVKINDGKGSMAVEFRNGSKLAILSPNGDAVRSGAYDALVLDESGEPDAEAWDEIIAAVIPSFDTRGPGAQLILAGTAGAYRDPSTFWTTLHDPASGRLRYGVPDDIDPGTLRTWEDVRPLVDRIHPGLDGLTTLAIIESNFPRLGADRFAAEYLGHFGLEAGANTLVPSAQWRSRPGAAPTGITPQALAFAVHPGGAWTSVAVAWHIDRDASADLARLAWNLAGDDPDGPMTAVKIIHHQDGTARMAATLYRLWKQTRLPIVYNDSPQEKTIIRDLTRNARPRPQVQPVAYGGMVVAHSTLLAELRNGDNIAHWEGDTELDAAAAIAAPRVTGNGKVTLIGLPSSDPLADVTPLEAIALAAYALPAAGAGDEFDAPIMAS